jgi:hypothetical protein
MKLGWIISIFSCIFYVILIFIYACAISVLFVDVFDRNHNKSLFVYRMSIRSLLELDVNKLDFAAPVATSGGSKKVEVVPKYLIHIPPVRSYEPREYQHNDMWQFSLRVSDLPTEGIAKLQEIEAFVFEAASTYMFSKWFPNMDLSEMPEFVGALKNIDECTLMNVKLPMYKGKPSFELFDTDLKLTYGRYSTDPYKFKEILASRYGKKVEAMIRLSSIWISSPTASGFPGKFGITYSLVQGIVEEGDSKEEVVAPGRGVWIGSK